MSALHLTIAALLAGLLGLERKAFLQAMVSRPLVAGALVGAVLGRPLEGLVLGASLELFFLGAVSLGASISDNELCATVAATACACSLLDRVRLPLFSALGIAVVVALPMAKLGLLADRLSERLNDWIFSRDGNDIALVRARLRRNLYGLWMPFLTTAAACVAGALLGAYALPRFLLHTPAALPRALSMAWVAFLVVGTASAVRAARTAHAFLYAGLAAVVVAGAQALRLFMVR